jgi:formylglycine-generating enzyme required for sulfatase activity
MKLLSHALVFLFAAGFSYLTTALEAQDTGEARTALVIGVADYHDAYFPSLSAPASDARSMAEALKALGFEVTMKLNATRREMLEATDAFGQKLTRRQGVGLFYFSGHGSSKPDEADPNYLIPAGTSISSREDLPQEAFNAQRVANRMKEAGNRLNLIFLDACRNNALPSRGKEGTGGLAAMRGARGLMFFFATQPNQIALEDATTHRSMFTSALLRHIATPGLSFMDMMSDVTAETERLTTDDVSKFVQSPFISGTLSGRFAFVPGAPLDPDGVLRRATKESPFVNSLGMRFVPAGTPDVLFSIYDTRVKDFTAFVEETKYDAIGNSENGGPAYTLEKTKDGKGADWAPAGGSWKNPHFPAGHEQDEEHPVLCVSYLDAEAFCAWLTKKEHASGKLPGNWSYRLPTDSEWSRACGSEEFPWGDSWPPGKRDGNYCGQEAMIGVYEGSSNDLVKAGYKDGYARTSPVGSFKPNAFGLYDMGGNVLQWCSTWYRASMNTQEVLEAFPAIKDDGGGEKYRVLRGASWFVYARVIMHSTFRYNDVPRFRHDGNGFRCVVGVGGGR